MTTYARITDGTVQEAIDFDPAGRFTSEIAALFTQVPDGTKANDILNPDGTWTIYVPPVVVPPAIDPAIEIRKQLAEIDAKSESPRARREALLGNTTWLESLDAQAAALRAQL